MGYMTAYGIFVDTISIPSPYIYIYLFIYLHADFFSQIKGSGNRENIYKEKCML